MGVYHLVVNLVCVLPLLERFEAGHGTLTSVALFFGRECFWASLIHWLGKELTRVSSILDSPGSALRGNREVRAAVEHMGRGSKVSKHPEGVGRALCVLTGVLAVSGASF
jgi:hypothetical protein